MAATATTNTTATALNPNAPVYYPSPLLSPPLELYYPPSSLSSSQPLLLLPNPSFQQHPFYLEYHQTPSHTSLLYASSPTPQPFYYCPPPQTLYSYYYYLTAPPLPIPQRATIEEIMEKDDQDAGLSRVGRDRNTNKVEEVRVRSSGCFGRKKVFAPKPKSRRRASPPQPPLPPPPLPEPQPPSESSQKRRVFAEFEFSNEENVEGENKTTVMIKNLPNKFTKEKLMGILDQHCYEENQQLRYLKQGDNEESQENDPSEFDFFYLPIDFRSGSNLGYAFVNFTNPAAAWRVYRCLHNYEWKLHGSRKVCEVTYARIQGLDALLRHFKNSVFICSYDEFLPVYFDPPRDGVQHPEQQFVGKRLSPMAPPPGGAKGRRTA